MRNALIGYTGFVGKNLNKERFSEFINSKNIGEYRHQKFDLLVISAGDARKWYANKHPSEDMLHMLKLFNDVKNIAAKKVVVMSTIDVYPDNLPGLSYNENSTSYSDLPYGINRLMFEKLIAGHYDDVSVIRLPGLFGRELKKNIIFDLCNDRADQLTNYNLDSKYQYFNLKDLDEKIDFVIEKSHHILNMATEPISIREIANYIGVPESLFSTTSNIASYDIRSVHAESNYFFDKATVLESIRGFYKNYEKFRV
jgi:nucleoside-diphosphate-sugar epimerase